MPVAIGPPVVEAPPSTGIPPSLRERWIWVSPDGTEFELTNFANGVEVVKGMSGRGAPPARIDRDRVPGKPGERTRQATHGMRELTMPLFVDGGNFDGLHDLLELLTNYMDPVSGVGILRRVSRDGVTNELFCRLVSGLGINGEGSSGPAYFRPILVFQADDPYWYGPVENRKFSGSTGQAWFPILPLRLGSSSVIGDASIYNDSTVETYPVWTLIGPGTDPVLTNTTTGKTLAIEFPAPLSAGQKVVIDAREYIKSVTGPAGENWRRYMTQRSMWPLVPGFNSLSLSMDGTTDASYITMNYRIRKLYAR